jgi:Holliday junction resolvase-like predicted endonuclease
MTDRPHALGLVAEAATDRWLRAAGWTVVGLRLRPRVAGGGEIDIVALDPTGILVAIEVRARTSRRTGQAALSVDGRRVARLRRSLAAVGAAAGVPHRGLRVDLVACEPVPDLPGRWRLERVPGIG